MKQFIKDMLTSHSGTSSKRVCGVLGWLVCIIILIYCTIADKQAPQIMDTIIFAVCILLGVDSITGIWKPKIRN